MLRFDDDEDAVFIGKEAEGPHQGLPTVFIVGNPRPDWVKYGIASVPYAISDIGVYLGAGGRINRQDIFTAANLDNALDHFFNSTNNIGKFRCWRITIECKDIMLMEDFIPLVDKYAMFDIRWHWFLPLVYPNYTAKLPLNIDIDIIRRTSIALSFKIYVKGLVLIAPAYQCALSNYDENQGFYSEDRLIMSSKEKQFPC